MGGSKAKRKRVRLHRALERVVAHGHPWIYRDALAPFEARPGELVEVLDRKGKFLALGWAEAGPIGVRVLTTAKVNPDAVWLEARGLEALARRDRLRAGWGDTDAYRIFHGEGDGLPGFVCDRYGAYAVLKLDGEAAQARLDEVRAWLEPALRARGVEHLLLRSGRGAAKRVEALYGELPAAPVEFREHGMRMFADLVHGQKTGMFLDHRASRKRVRELARDAEVLNLYAYTGGFSIAAGLGGAKRVTSVDVAAPALELAERGWAANDLDAGRHRVMPIEVEAAFDRFRTDKERFSLIVSDPPNFAPNQKSKAKAIAAYKALHRACLEHLEPGGLWLAASCSSHVHRPDFEATLREVAHAARRDLRVLGRWSADADHPVPIGFPEGDYLTVVLASAGR